MATRDSDEPQHAFRFLDVNEEPLTTLPPIHDYDNTPLVSLHEAVAPLEPIVSNIKGMIQTVMENYVEPEDGLTRDQSNSIRLYTLEWQPRERSLFHILNRTLRSPHRQHLQPWFLFLKLISMSVSHLPSIPLMVYRGANMDLSAQYVQGSTVTWWGFSSCMKRSELLEKRLFLNKTGKRTLFVISCYSGKDIHRHSLYKTEGEVLLLPARQFTVVSCVKKGKGLCVIELNEMEPTFDFYDASSPVMSVSIGRPLHNVEFQPISTVSLSKKSLPAALPNPKLEEHLAYFFKQRCKVDLRHMWLSDSDMDIVVSEMIIKRQCMELDLSQNNITHSGIATLAHALRRNKVREIISPSPNDVRLAAFFENSQNNDSHTRESHNSLRVQLLVVCVSAMTGMEHDGFHWI